MLANYSFVSFERAVKIFGEDFELFKPQSSCHNKQR